VAALRARHLPCCICKAADSDNVLLGQPDDEEELSMLAKEV
jgi:hypothetical protein